MFAYISYQVLIKLQLPEYDVDVFLALKNVHKSINTQVAKNQHFPCIYLHLLKSIFVTLNRRANTN